MSAISSINATSGLLPSDASQSSNPSQTLNQADFLKLLVKQMTSQDPLSPESDTDMAAQMAQFSSLQASQSTETDLQGLQANSLIGKTVIATSTGSPQTGVVTSVVMQPGSPPELIVNGQPFTLKQLSAIFPTIATPEAVAANGSGSSSAASGTSTGSAANTNPNTY